MFLFFLTSLGGKAGKAGKFGRSTERQYNCEETQTWLLMSSTDSILVGHLRHGIDVCRHLRPQPEKRPACDLPTSFLLVLLGCAEALR
jgi:hypothetical protein